MSEHTLHPPPLPKHLAPPRGLTNGSCFLSKSIDPLQIITELVIKPKLCSSHDLSLSLSNRHTQSASPPYFSCLYHQLPKSTRISGSLKKEQQIHFRIICIYFPSSLRVHGSSSEQLCIYLSPRSCCPQPAQVPLLSPSNCTSLAAPPQPLSPPLWPLFSRSSPPCSDSPSLHFGVLFNGFVIREVLSIPSTSDCHQVCASEEIRKGEFMCIESTYILTLLLFPVTSSERYCRSVSGEETEDALLPWLNHFLYNINGQELRI